MAKKRYINPKTGQISVGAPKESLGTTTPKYTPGGPITKGGTPVGTRPWTEADQARAEWKGGYKARTPEELAAAGFIPQLPAQVAEKEKAIGEIGKVPPVQTGQPFTQTDEYGNVTQFGAQPEGVNLVEAGTTGAAAIGGGIAGAKFGTAVGAIGGPAGAVAGGVIGGIGGAAAGAITKLTYQKRQDVKEAFTNYGIAKTNFDKIINNVNAGLMTSTEAVQEWNEQLMVLYASEANLKKDTDSNLNKFLSGGVDELSKVTDYKNNSLPILQRELINAIMTPNPMKIIQTPTEA